MHPVTQSKLLVVDDDPTILAVLRDGLSSSNTLACFEAVKHRRFEAAFIDFSIAGTAVDALRSSPSSKTAIIIAIAADAEQSRKAFARGVHFVLQHPVSRSAVDGIIRAAYGLIIRERRRYFRCPIEVWFLAHRRTEGIWLGQVVNVSEAGLCVSAPVSLERGELLELQFTIPSSSIEINAECEVQWVDESSGRTGLRFLRIDGEGRSEMMQWLSIQLDEELKYVPIEQGPKVIEDRDPKNQLLISPEVTGTNRKRPYLTPKIESHKTIGDLPSKFRAIAEDVLNEHPILKVRIDREHRSVSVSEELARLLGYSSRELRGKRIEDITSNGATDVEHILSVIHRLRDRNSSAEK